MKRFAALGILVSICATVRADVKMPAIFGDHMVVQRGMKIPVWGSADAGEKVTVKALQQEQSATTDDKGKWRVTLDPITSNDPIAITVNGKNSITIKDVLVGEVWLCSGQSNMEFHLDRASNKVEALAAADRPKLRLFTVKRKDSEEPLDDVDGKWELSNADTAQAFSAVGYFFGVQLQEKLDVPVGLIHSSWGGTRAESWMPKSTFDRLNLPYEPAWTEEWVKGRPAQATTLPEHPTAMQRSATRPTPPRPYNGPAVLYNGMIHPLVGFAMRGAIWYQGESNSPHAEKYHDVLAAMIKSWRDVWGEGDFPFLIVQLANFHADGRWAELREAQAQMTTDLPNVGLALAIDIGEPKDIHPKNKAEVGRRLSLVAMKIAYGKDVVYSGPVIKSMQVEGNKATLTFDHTDGGLVVKGDALDGFEIAGDDGKFVQGTAAIQDDKVIVTAQGVASPTQVRYGWADDPKSTLYNKSDLPAVPFQAKKK